MAFRGHRISWTKEEKCWEILWDQGHGHQRLAPIDLLRWCSPGQGGYSSVPVRAPSAQGNLEAGPQVESGSEWRLPLSMQHVGSTKVNHGFTVKALLSIFMGEQILESFYNLLHQLSITLTNTVLARFHLGKF